MEGTRHEKAALISVAYFIGALTAFIWYGASQTADLSVIAVTEGQPASVIKAVKEVKPAEPVAEVEVAPLRTGIALYNKGVLDVQAIGGTKVLSFNPEVSGFPGSPEFVVQGTHVGDLSFAVSPTEEYIFFCEQKSLEVSTCSPFIYDVLADKIYSLSAETGAFDVTLNTAKSAVWVAGGLSLGGVVSVDPSTPWLMNTN
jgi:hypothetical protein